MAQVYLVGTDCSNCGNRAVDYAVELAACNQAKLVVAHVIEWSRFSFNTPQENEVRHQRREQEIARAHEEIIDPLVDQLREKGFEVEGVVRHGHAAETLDQVAREQGASCIIIGRKGSSKLKAQLFGSVAGSLVQISACPVTVVP